MTRNKAYDYLRKKRFQNSMNCVSERTHDFYHVYSLALNNVDSARWNKDTQNYEGINPRSYDKMIVDFMLENY